MRKPVSAPRFNRALPIFENRTGGSLLGAICLAIALAGCSKNLTAPTKDSDTQDVTEESTHYEAAKAAYLRYLTPPLGRETVSHPSRDYADDPGSYLRSATQEIDAYFRTRERPVPSLSLRWSVEDQIARMSVNPRGQGILRLVHLAAESLDRRPISLSDVTTKIAGITRLPLLLRFLRHDALVQARQNKGAEAARDLSDCWNLGRLQCGKVAFAFQPQTLDQMDLTLAEIPRCAAILCPQIKPNPTMLSRKITWTLESATPVVTTRGPAVQPGNRENLNWTPKTVPSQFAQFANGLRLHPGLASFSELVTRLFADENSVQARSSQRDSATVGVPRELCDRARWARQFEFAITHRTLFQRLDADPVGAGRALDQSLEELKREGKKSNEGLLLVPRTFEEMGRKRERLLEKRDLVLILMAAVRGHYRQGDWHLPPLPVPGVHIQRSLYTKLNVVIQGPGCVIARDDLLLPRKPVSQQPITAGAHEENPVVEVSFPPDETREEIEADVDTAILNRLPVDDLAETSQLFPQVSKAYNRAGLPFPTPQDSADSDYALQLGPETVVQTSSPPGSLDTVDVGALDRLLAKSEKARNADRELGRSDPSKQGKSATYLVHTCSDRLVRLFCDRAAKAAKAHHGSEAANALNSAWGTLKALLPDPPSYAVQMAGWEIERISATIEQCACALDHDQLQFEKFQKSLLCNDEPLPSSRFLRAQVRTVILETSQTPDDSFGRKTSRTVALPKEMSHLAMANLVRIEQFWLKHAAVLRSGGNASFLQVLADLGTVVQQKASSYELLKSSIHTIVNSEGPELGYLLRGADGVLIKCIDSRLRTGKWPKALSEVPGADPDHQWEILRDDRTFQIVPRHLIAFLPAGSRPKIVVGAHDGGLPNQVCASDPPLRLP